MMASQVRSFKAYTAFIRERLEMLQPRAVFAFCVWCLERFEPELGGLIWDGLEPNEVMRLKAIIAELQARVAEGAIPPAPLAIALRGEVEQMGSQDDEIYAEDTAELGPECLEFLTALSNTLGYAQQHELGFACSVSEAWINLRDHSASGDADYSLETMFDHPDLKYELERQVEQLDGLTSA